MSCRFHSTMTVLLLLAASSAAQLVGGSLGVIDLTAQQVSVVSPTGQVSVVSPVGGFGGTGIPQSLLWDDEAPDGFFVGGDGFVGRLTMSLQGAPTWQLLSSAVGEVASMSRTGASTLFLYDGGADVVWQLDLGTGVLTQVASTTTPWGAALNAGLYDSAAGVHVIGGANGLWTLDGSGAVTTIASGWSTGISFVTALLLEPATGQYLAALSGVDRVVRVLPGGGLQDLTAPGAITFPNALDLDVSTGEILVGGLAGQVFRLPAAGGPPILEAATGSGALVTGVARTRAVFRVVLEDQGAGAALIAMVDLDPVAIEGGMASSFNVSQPLGQGPLMGFTPDAFTLALITAFPAAQPGNPIHFTLPPLPGLFPSIPFAMPSGIVPVGVTFDLVGAATDAQGQVMLTPVLRVTLMP
ncbi:MAG TPA: hypothetical protein ENK43_13055 [Planctomycetes bacterium]|nr:hypothetical protein [Planctomycetota bacterium]